jgi:hypothetical protein
MKPCPACHVAIAKDAAVCPICGHDQSQPVVKRRSVPPEFGCVALIVLALAALIFSFVYSTRCVFGVC